MASTVPTLAAAAFGALLLVVPPTHAGGSDPQVVLDEIFGQVDAMCSGEGNGPAYDIFAIAEQYFAPNLAKVLNDASENGTLGFDVLVDGQDCRVSALDLRVTDDNGRTATGHAEFQNFGEQRSIDLVMAKRAESWEVTDIVYRHRPFSLRAGE